VNDEEYMTVQTQLQAIGGLVLGMDLDGFLERIDRAETLTPILNPTLWMRGAEKLREVREIAEAVRDVQKVARRQVAAACRNQPSAFDGKVGAQGQLSPEPGR
jgi:hypothetical protein